MKKIVLNLNRVQTVFGVLGMTLITCGSALAGVVNISGPNDNGREYDGGGMVIDCSVTGETVGIELVNVVAARIKNYEVRNCWVGVSITGGSENEMSMMYVHDSGTDGIQLNHTNWNVILKGNTSYNHRHGIFIMKGSFSNRFYTMVMDGNWVDGYICDGDIGNSSRYNVIAHSEISANGRHGLFLKEGCDYSKIRLSTIANNLYEGFYIRSSHNTIRHNTITGNIAEGIKLRTYATGNIVEINDISQNGQQGIENKGDNNYFTYNTLNDNHDQGIQLESGANGNFITGNTATNNRKNDLEDLNFDCDSNTWSSNLYGTSNAACIH